MPTHTTESTKEFKDKYPRGIPPHFKAIPEGARYSSEDILSIAEEAWNSQEVVPSLMWDQLDTERQRNYYDVATDICLHGGPSPSSFEQSVARVLGTHQAGAVRSERRTASAGSKPHPEPVLDSKAQVIATQPKPQPPKQEPKREEKKEDPRNQAKRPIPPPARKEEPPSKKR